ncbi:MAG: flavodoxin family protein, partial [Bacillota bacterium]|nr:flavodoxin family protein [Bacillota bacterium]
MKIVSITSSLRQSGNTETIVQMLEGSLAKLDESVQITHISLAKTKVEQCRGCRICFDRDESFCPIKDELSGIIKEIKDADAIIIASPVYVEDVNGTMKSFIDRMAFNSHRPSLYGKCAALITTSGAGSSNHALNTMKNAFSSWGANI